MIRLTKRMRVMHEKFDKKKQYSIDEAFILLKELSSVNFVESVDVAIRLGIDTRRSDQNIRNTIVLPHGIGRTVRIAVFTQGQNAIDAKIAGAEMVGMEELAEHIKKRNMNFNVVIASPDAMYIVSQLGQILGPRGLMPNPKIGTVTQNIAEAVRNARSGLIYYRNDRNGIVHTSIGKINFEVNALKENFLALLKSLKTIKPIQVKGIYLEKISISTTMGIGIAIDQTSLSNILN